MPSLRMKRVFNKVKRAPMPFIAKPMAKGIADKVLTHSVQTRLALADPGLAEAHPRAAGPCGQPQ